MDEPNAERLRRIAHQLSEELGSVLSDVEEVQMPSCPQPEVHEAMEQIIQIENELTAPRLSALDASERAALFAEIAAFFLDPGGNGGESHYRDALDRALGRWTRRKIKRIVEETNLNEIETQDHEAWGSQLRAMAAAQAIDRNGGDLRSVLCALLALENGDSPQPDFEGAEIATLASTSDSARRLLAQITRMLCEKLDHAR